MKTNYWLGLAALLTTAVGARAQDYPREFGTAFHAGDTAATGQVLRRWYKAQPKDPEFYIARFNYLLKQGDAIEMRPGSGAPGSMVIKDKKSRVVGSLGSGYLPTMVEQACAVLRQGLTIAPERLDMWFGLAKTYEETHQPAEQVKALSEALATHAAGKQEWRWRNGEALPAPEAEFVPRALEQYASEYWQQDDPQAWETGRQLAELIMRYYPQSALGPFNMGAYYGIKGDPKHAYPLLQQADKLEPNDPTNVGNLARMAIKLGYQAEAKAYVARLQKYPEAAKDAEALSRQLK